MKTKTEIPEKIREWHASVSLETGEKAVIFRTDNAKKYQKFDRMIDDVHMKFTTAYTPEKNEVAERYNRTIVQMARSMLIWAELPQKF